MTTTSKAEFAMPQNDHVARIQRHLTDDRSVIVSPRIASWLERRAGVTADQRARFRDVDPEAYGVLAALHLAALHHTSSDCGTKVAQGQPLTTKSEVWFTTSEAAKQVGVTDRCIRKWITEGRLPATRHGARWLINREALEAVKVA